MLFGANLDWFVWGESGRFRNADIRSAVFDVALQSAEGAEMFDELIKAHDSWPDWKSFTNPAL